MNARDFYARLSKAVALTYDDRLPAPYISAKGAGITAQRIRDLAEEAGVPVVEDRVLTEPLFDLEVHDFIPEELYRSVAALYVFVQGLDRGS
jgi:type III secretion system FlhB-like substrate exporter